MLASYTKSRSAAFALTIFLTLSLGAQGQSGSSTSITGTVLDPSGAVVPNAIVGTSLSGQWLFSKYSNENFVEL